MTEFMKKYKLKITVLSPVHIGASTDLEPTEYVIYKKTATTGICPECGEKFEITDKTPIGKGHYLCPDCLDLDLEIPLSVPESSPFLYTFTPGQLSEALPQNKKTELLNIVKRDDSNVLQDLQKFFRNNAETIAAKATKRAQVAFSIAKTYNEMKTDNRFYIERQISDPVTGLPYIPGSSIKGAIRTALMSLKNDRRKLEKSLYKKGADAEKALYDYKNPTNDPFKALKIEDGLASIPFITSIDTAENVKRKTDAASGQRVSTYMEVVPAGTVFESSLSIMQNEVFPDDMASIQHACNDFYSDILSDQEDHQIHTHGISAALFEKIRKSAENSRHAFLLCLGKHGGAESKTIDGLRNIRIMQGKGKPARFDDHATTYWFANDGRERLPFGWCVVEFEEEK